MGEQIIGDKELKDIQSPSDKDETGKKVINTDPRFRCPYNCLYLYLLLFFDKKINFEKFFNLFIEKQKL